MQDSWMDLGRSIVEAARLAAAAHIQQDIEESTLQATGGAGVAADAERPLSLRPDRAKPSVLCVERRAG